MVQNNPHPPQPDWSGPASAPAGQPSDKPGRRRTVLIAVACAAGALVLTAGGTAAFIAATGWQTWHPDVPAITQTPPDNPEPSPANTVSGQDTSSPLPGDSVGEFKAFVATYGTDTEQDAAAHVTKIQGLETLSTDFPEVMVFTDFVTAVDSYDETIQYEGQATLIAAAIAAWKPTGDGSGWITIYSATGHELTTSYL